MKMKKKPIARVGFFDPDETGQKKTSSGLMATAFSLSSMFIKNSLVGMPFALKEAGFGLGIILLVFMVGLIAYTLELLIHATELAKSNSFNETAKKAFKVPGYMITTFLNFLHPTLGMTFGNIVITDNISRLIIRFTDISNIVDLQSRFWGTRVFISGVFILGIELPLSMYRHVSHLTKLICLSLIAVVLVIVVYSIRLFTLDLPPTPNAYEFGRVDFVQSISMFTSIYMVHLYCNMLYNGMSGKNEKRWNTVTHLAIGFGLAGSLTIGIIGYVTFTGNTQGNIFENYCSHDDLMNAARLFTTLASLVMYIFPLNAAREVLYCTLSMNNETEPLYRYFLVSVLLLGIPFALSLITDCLGIIIQVAGFVVTVPLAIILPPLMVLKLQKTPIASWSNMHLLLVLTLGLLISGIGLPYTIYELLAEGFVCTSGSEPAYCFSNQTVV